jgi:hypothetical protein
LANLFSIACTTAVISGKYTKDGRPMLLKNRDTWAINNSMHYFNLKPFSFIGLVNSKDTLGKSIWIGNNEAGFAIMNSASYNLNVGDTLKQNGLEGQLMKKALQYCKTIDDFQNMLDTIQKPYLLEANFGVIDAQGGAAYFELGNNKYIKIDVNDPAVAPFGYVIRTNFSFTGQMGIGGGYIRYQTASELFYNAVSTNDLDVKYVVQKVFRSLNHSLTKSNLYDYSNIPENTPTYFHFRDFIPRTGSSSAVVVQGVKKGDNPDKATIWAVVGFPLTSVVIPFWVKGGTQIPDVAAYNSTLKDSPICNAALSFKSKCFPEIFGSTESYYLNINALVNSNYSGYIQKLQPIENQIFDKTFEFQNKWNNKDMSQQNIDEYYSWVNNFIVQQYSLQLNYKL